MPKRTTLTLDDDVAAKLDQEARRTGESFRAAVNRIIRRGLHPVNRSRTRERFRVHARDLGLREGVEIDNVDELLDRIEGPRRR